MLNPKPETEDLSPYIYLSEYNSIQPSEINISNISPSTPTLYQEYQTKITGDDTSESINNISFIKQSDKCQPSKLRNATKYQPIPISSTLVKTVPQSKEKVESSIIEFKLQTPSTKKDQRKNQLPFSSRMLQALNIETTLVENYDQLRKQLKMQNFVNYNDYKAITARLEVKLCSTEDILLKELSKLEKLILMGNNAVNVVLETTAILRSIMISL